MTRRLLLAPLLLLACPSTAGAATVSVGTRQDFPQAPVYGVIHYDAVAGEANDLTWSFPAAGGIRFHDTGAPISPGAGCRAVDARTADCTSDRTAWFVDAQLGDGADSAAPAATEGTNVLVASIQLHGGGGKDTLHAGATPVALFGDAGDDTLQTGTRFGSADGGEGNDIVSGNGSLNGGPGNDEIRAGSGYASLSGGTGDDLVFGGTGNDYLNGGGGHDRLFGGAGNDSIADGDGPGFPFPMTPGAPSGPTEQPVDSDELDGGPGSDTLEYGMRTRAVTVDLSKSTAGQAGENDHVSGFENADSGGGNDRLVGDERANRFSGGNGRDSIITGGGDDSVYSNWTSAISLGSGDDSLLLSRYGSAGTRPGVVDCGAGSDTVRYPNPKTRTPRGCETLNLRSYALVHRPETRAPRVQCGPFRRRPVDTPCTFRLRMQLPAGNAVTGYETGGTPLGATSWRDVAVGTSATFALHLGPYGRAQLRARGTMPVRVILERRTTSRKKGYIVGSYITIFR